MTAQPLTLSVPTVSASARAVQAPTVTEEQKRRQQKHDADTATAFIRTIVTALAEVDCGIRSLQSIEKWLSPEVREQVAAGARMRRLLRSERPTYTIRAIGWPRMTVPRPGVIEAAISIALLERTKACAVRLEKLRDRWVVREYMSA